MKKWINVSQGLLTTPDGKDWPVLATKTLEAGEEKSYLAYGSIQPVEDSEPAAQPATRADTGKGKGEQK